MSKSQVQTGTRPPRVTKPAPTRESSERSHGISHCLASFMMEEWTSRVTRILPTGAPPCGCCPGRWPSRGEGRSARCTQKLKLLQMEFLAPVPYFFSFLFCLSFPSVGLSVCLWQPAGMRLGNCNSTVILSHASGSSLPPPGREPRAWQSRQLCSESTESH